MLVVGCSSLFMTFLLGWQGRECLLIVFVHTLDFQILFHLPNIVVILLLHVVDAAGTEGRDPIEDIRAINEELEKYDPELMKKPQIIVANKCDAIVSAEGAEDPVSRIRREYETESCPVFAISAVTGEGTKELLSCIQKKLQAR